MVGASENYGLPRQAKRIAGMGIEKLSLLFYDHYYVTYKMFSGLGNRLRHHCVAAAYALMTGRKLVTSWERNIACYATYDDLFQPLSFSLDRLPALERWQLNRWLWHPEDHNRFDIDVNTLNGGKDVHALPAHRKERVVHIPEDLETFIGAGDRLGQYYEPVMATLVPRPELQGAADEVTAEMTYPRIGIHIRSGDFPPEDSGIEPTFPGAVCPPVSRFVDIIQSIRQVYPQASFFISTNAEKDYLEPLTSAFEITRREVINKRDAVDGIKDALVDMMILANCDMIVGTPFSSFNEFAAFWKKKPLVRAKKNEWQQQLDQAMTSLQNRVVRR